MSLPDEELRAKVKDIICNCLKLKDDKKDSLDDNTNLITDLNLDSLDFVDLVMALEDGFSIQIPDADVEDIKNIGDIVKYIANKITA